MRKNFISEEKMKQARRKMNDPEEKIVEWMDKINIMKQLERKKILGLSWVLIKKECDKSILSQKIFI